MIINFWKYLNGYVIIRVTGFSPERFINLCANKDIYIWNIRKVPDGYYISMSTKAFFMLRPIVKKTGCRVKIVKKVGMPFRLAFFRKRRFFLVGIFLSLVIIYSFSFFLWHIEVEGNKQYTEEEIIKYLGEREIKIGSFIPDIKASEINDMMSKDFDKTMWVSTEVIGTKLKIYIREGVTYEEEEVFEGPADIVADESGIIVSIITRDGAPLVKEGDVVEKGDVLITGTLEIMELTQFKGVEFTTADGDIYIEREYKYVDDIDINYLEKVYITEEEKNDYSFLILNMKINLFSPRINNQKCDKIYTNDQLVLFENFYLPFYMMKEVYKPYYLIEKNYSYDEGKTILENRLNSHLNELSENGTQVIDTNIVFTKDDYQYEVEGTIKIIQKVGKQVAFDENLRRQEYNEYLTDDNGDTP